jgi:hypothetical protein
VPCHAEFLRKKSIQIQVSFIYKISHWLGLGSFQTFLILQIGDKPDVLKTFQKQFWKLNTKPKKPRVLWFRKIPYGLLSKSLKEGIFRVFGSERTKNRWVFSTHKNLSSSVIKANPINQQKKKEIKENVAQFNVTYIRIPHHKFYYSLFFSYLLFHICFTFLLFDMPFYNL